MSGDLYPGDLVARRVLRALNCAVMGWILFSSALYVKRKNAKDRKRLELVTIGCMLMSFVCVFLVTINIVLLPFRGTPATDFECNLFERGGNITNFVMYAGMVYFFYLRTETIRKNIMSTNFIKTPLFTWLCTSLAYAIIVGFFATCAYIESFPLRAEECFFGVPPFVGTLVISLLAASAFTFLIIFTYILLKETLMSEALRRKAITCWVTTLLAFITESMCFLVLNHYFADELWNMVLHMDMTWNMVLLAVNLSDWKARLLQNPFKPGTIINLPTVSTTKDRTVKTTGSTEKGSKEGLYPAGTSQDSKSKSNAAVVPVQNT